MTTCSTQSSSHCRRSGVGNPPSFYTGTQKILDTGRRVDLFMRSTGRAASTVGRPARAEQDAAATGRTSVLDQGSHCLRAGICPSRCGKPLGFRLFVVPLKLAPWMSRFDASGWRWPDRTFDHT